MRNLLCILLFISTSIAWGQVKVGDNINTIDSASILELESSTKALVVTRMTTVQMNAVNPLNGAMVYNTDESCLFVYDGANWKTLCDSQISVSTASMPPLSAKPGDIWFNDTNNTVSIWDGTNWIPIPKSTLSGNGIPDITTAPNAVSGDIYVDLNTGGLYTYTGTDWVNQTLYASNGITRTATDTLELGGTLTKATEISTDAINTLSINGLEEVIANQNAIVTTEESTGILRKTPISSIVQQEEVVIIANDAQTQFTPPLTITNSKKLNVYRNGVKLGFTVIDDSTIELETPVVCYQNDEIRIVQFY